MRHIKLHPLQTQFSLKCVCGDLRASGVLETAAFEEFLKIILVGHEEHRYDLERRDGKAKEVREAA